MVANARRRRVLIVGGAGRIGLPLAVAFANHGLDVTILDTSAERILALQQHPPQIPFHEPGLQDELLQAAASGSLHVTSSYSVLTDASDWYAIVIAAMQQIGTDLSDIDTYSILQLELVRKILSCISVQRSDESNAKQLLVLRFTLAPSTFRQVENLLEELNLRNNVLLSYCPERIAEGRAQEELYTLPQIISARDDGARDGASALFRSFLPADIPIITDLLPEEAEISKLMSNTYRYAKFAIANEFYRLTTEADMDFERIAHSIRHRNPRAADLPRAGLTAGPCLAKDTFWLNEWASKVRKESSPSLIRSALFVNQTLPDFVASMIARAHDLKTTTVGLLGLTFKPDCDDIRGSQSFAIRKALLQRGAKAVLCHDPFCSPMEYDVHPLSLVTQVCDIVVIATPHSCFAKMRFNGPTIDMSGLLAKERRGRIELLPER